MSATTAIKPWTLAAFFEWQQGLEDRFELVDGFPLKMMTGASRRHDMVVMNILGELRNRLRGKPCVPFTADGAVETRPGQIRRPDVGVDCGPTDPNSFVASEPRIVFEVLLPSTRDFDRLRKIEEYKTMPFLRHIVLMEQDQPVAILWSRLTGAGWDETRIEGLDGVISLAAIGVELPLHELYDRVLT
ncbi:Uma2 family endonuclease [Aureimonas ureilytica]|uniref:Uma2 family endonuclease n=1 Tax=Aureimonas ureilytica TaxID=401562 RepID=UPI000733F1CB|nr:Uma2 family endonuclease [Aureimonas ureilytica]